MAFLVMATHHCLQNDYDYEMFLNHLASFRELLYAAFVSATVGVHVAIRLIIAHTVATGSKLATFEDKTQGSSHPTY